MLESDKPESPDEPGDQRVTLHASPTESAPSTELGGEHAVLHALPPGEPKTEVDKFGWAVPEEPRIHGGEGAQHGTISTLSAGGSAFVRISLRKIFPRKQSFLVASGVGALAITVILALPMNGQLKWWAAEVWLAFTAVSFIAFLLDDWAEHFKKIAKFDHRGLSISIRACTFLLVGLLLVALPLTAYTIVIDWPRQVPVTGGVHQPRFVAQPTQMVQLIYLKPNERFHGTIPGVPRPTTVVFAQLVVQDNGAATTASDWSAWLTIDGTDIRGTILPLPDVTFRPFPNAPAIAYPQAEAIYNVTVTHPITQSEPARGFIFVYFDFAPSVVQDNLGSLRFRFKADDTGVYYETEEHREGRFRHQAEVVPGIGHVVP